MTRTCVLTATVVFAFCSTAYPQSNFVRGDANADRAINITDAVFVLNFLFLGGREPSCLDAADVDDRGTATLNITDPIYLLDFLFSGGAAPPAPTSGSSSYDPSACGPDPTDDALSCVTFDICPPGQPPPPTIRGHVRLTKDRTIRIEGSTQFGTSIEVAGGASAVMGEPIGAAYSVLVPLEPNRLNRLYITAISMDGVRSAPASTAVTQDETPPSLHIDFPATGGEVTFDRVVVAGRVSDMLSGFIAPDVTVNDERANVAIGIGTNGTFERSVQLAMGENILTARATDAVGNSAPKSVTIRRVPLVGPRIEVVSGDLQAAPIHTLVEPLVVRVLDEAGLPLSGRAVRFRVRRSDGILSITVGGQTSRLLEVPSASNGTAQAFYTLGSDAGCGNNRVEVTAEGVQGAVYLCASATPGPAVQINIGSGNNQRVEVGAPAPESLRAWVSDGCNGLGEIDVTFAVTQGAGLVNGAERTTVRTSPTGHAEVSFVLGRERGNNIVEANFDGNMSSPAVFVAFGVERNEAEPTSFHGLVLDNAHQPIQGATCMLEFRASGATAVDTTDVNGQFRLDDLTEAGPAALFVNGLAAIHVGGSPGRDVPQGSFPSLLYDVVVVPNAENSLPSPVLLPPLNPNNAQTYDGTRDVDLSVEGIEGLRMIVRRGTVVTVPGGLVVDGKNGKSTVLSLDQVHHDKVPMPMPDGAAPPFAWTLQPAGATFDPPVQIVYPNMSGLAPGSLAFFLSFNHDTEQFEIVATGQVEESGECIVSDPGSGIGLAGWGCSCPPYAVTGSCKDPCDKPEPPCCPAKVQAARFALQGIAALFLAFCGSGSYATDHLQTFLSNVGGAINYGDGSPIVQDIKSHQEFLSALATLELEVCLAIRADQVNPQFPTTARSMSFYAPPAGCLTVANQLTVGLGAVDSPTIEVSNLRINGTSYSADTTWRIRDPYDFTEAGYAWVDLLAIYLVNCKEAKVFTVDIEFTVPVKGDLADCRPSAMNAAPGPAGIGGGPIDGLAALASVPTWSLSVNGQTVTVDFSSGFSVFNIASPDVFGIGGPGTPPDNLSDDFLRVRAVSIQGGMTRYVFSESFQIRQGETYVVGDLTFTDFPPVTNHSLTVTARTPVLTEIGQEIQLEVAALLSNGEIDDGFHLRSKWTTYRTSNPSVLTIGPDGLATARGAGRAIVTAVNEGATAATRLLMVLDAKGTTTVDGIVQLENGTVVAGAAVTVVGQPASTASGLDGSFELDGVASFLDRPLSVAAHLNRDGEVLVGTVGGVSTLPGGRSHAGVITLTSIGVTDSDGDGVPDEVERRLGLNPTAVDSDGDGLLDSEEDTDEDLLPNLEELARGTDPGQADTDSDGLLDGAEFDGFTSPLRNDTDNDGLSDGTEVINGLDPLIALSLRSFVVSDGETLTLQGTNRIGSLTIESSGRVSTTPQNRVEIEAESIVVAEGGTIDVTGLGYRAGVGTQNGETYPGNRLRGARSSDGQQSGEAGSHGGTGRGFDTPPSRVAVYDTIVQPALPGAGGGSHTFGPGAAGGHGGGVIILRSGTIVLNGELRADGGRGVGWLRDPFCCPGGCRWLEQAGSGAGGSIRIHCEGIEGAGVISAVGGTNETSAQALCPNPAGLQGSGSGGGGGRIAVHFVENRFTGELQAAGGFGVDGWVQLAPEEWGPTGGRYLNGTAGTIYLRGPDHDYGELIIDNADLEPNGIATPLVAATIRSGTGTVDASGEIVTTDQVIYSDASGLTFGHIGRQVIIDGDLSNPLTVVEHGRDWMRLNRALRPESTVVYQGAFFFDSVTIRRKAWVTTLGERLIVPGGEPDVEEGSMLE